MGDKVKNQHFVPRSYLKFFAKKRGEEFEINVYDKETDKRFPSNIKGVASSRYFYDFPTLDEMKKDVMKRGNIEAVSNLEQIEQIEVQTVEKIFGDLEANFESKLSNIRSRYIMTPNPLEIDNAILSEEKLELSINLAYQLVRTRDFRENFFEVSERFTQYFADRFIEGKFPEIKPGTFKVVKDKKYAGLEHSAFMFNEDFLKIPLSLNSHIWVVGINKTNTPFYTSDTPVVKYAHKKDGFFSNSGIASPGIEIVFPINEKLILILRERSFFGDVMEIFENKFLELNDDNVEFYNWLQITQSNRQIYSSDPDFGLVDKIKKDNPDALKKRPKYEIIAGGQRL